MDNILINSLPVCSQRMGRVYDKIPVMTCGFREIEPTECVECGGFKTSMIKRE